MTVMQTTYRDVIGDCPLKDAIENTDMDGFREDFHVLHCLIKKYKPKRFLEIGTYMGKGTSIICNAGGKDMEVYSLDLAPELGYLSKQYPTPDKIGSLCKFPYTQLLGDSMTFDYKTISPLDGAFIDGEHEFHHVFLEICSLIDAGVWLFIFHDADMHDVYWAIEDAFMGEPFDLYRVSDTRMLYAIKNENAI